VSIRERPVGDACGGAVCEVDLADWYIEAILVGGALAYAEERFQLFKHLCIRQHTSAYVSYLLVGPSRMPRNVFSSSNTYAYVSIRQHTSL
jgi:hypothetical protein